MFDSLHACRIVVKNDKQQKQVCATGLGLFIGCVCFVCVCVVSEAFGNNTCDPLGDLCK